MDNVDEGPSSAGAYYSQDFEWEALREEVERMPEFSGQSIVSASPSLSVEKNLAPSTSTSWETFHTRHSRNLFFKERRYLTKEFPELSQAAKVVLEVGCGTGSSVVPIVRENPKTVVYACDCSAAALKKATEVVSSASFHPFLCDISLSTLPEFLCCSACRRRNSGTESHEPLGFDAATSMSSSRSLEGCCTGGLDSGLGLGFDAATSMNSSRSLPGHEDGCTGGLGPFDSDLGLGFGAAPSMNSSRRLSRHEGCCTGGLEPFDSGLGLGFDAATSMRSYCTGGFDIVTLIFTLSAIPVEKMGHVLSECFQVLKPGGLLLFRDYGLYDMTMLRFAPRQRISSCLYRRDDGTLSYFFSLDMVRGLLTGLGFLEQELQYCCVQLMNRRKQVPMKRVWVHAKFQKPDQTRR